MFSLWLIESVLRCVRRSMTISDTDLAPLLIECTHFLYSLFSGIVRKSTSFMFIIFHYYFFFVFFKRARSARHAKVPFLLELTWTADGYIVIKVYF